MTIDFCREVRQILRTGHWIGKGVVGGRFHLTVSGGFQWRLVGTKSLTASRVIGRKESGDHVCGQVLEEFCCKEQQRNE